MLSTSLSATLSGVSALTVTVEANSGEKGDPKCVLVGLPDASVKEAMDRVFSSIGNAGFSRPRTHVTINLAPGDLRKEGAAFDLPIALTLLSSTGQIQGKGLSDYLIAGELALSGAVRNIKGGLAMAILAKKLGLKGVLLPRASALEACLIEGVKVYAIDSLAEAVSFFDENSEKDEAEKTALLDKLFAARKYAKLFDDEKTEKLFAKSSSSGKTDSSSDSSVGSDGDNEIKLLATNITNNKAVGDFVLNFFEDLVGKCARSCPPCSPPFGPKSKI